MQEEQALRAAEAFDDITERIGIINAVQRGANMVYLISFGAGILAGVLYGVINVRSPAPPAIALIGLLGMLAGEQIVPVAKRVIEGIPLTRAWFASECQTKITGVPVNANTEAEDTRQG